MFNPGVQTAPLKIGEHFLINGLISLARLFH